MTRVPLARVRLLVGWQAELLGRVLPQQLVQLEMAEVRPAQEGLHDELGEKAQVSARNRDGGVAIEAAAENGQSRKRAATARR